MTRGELLARIPSGELAEWIAYSRIEPFGEERADVRAGIIASTIANCNRKKGAKAFEAKDFIPKWGSTGQPQTIEHQIRIAEMVTASLGGKDLRKKKKE